MNKEYRIEGKVNGIWLTALIPGSGKASKIKYSYNDALSYMEKIKKSWKDPEYSRASYKVKPSDFRIVSRNVTEWKEETEG